MKLLSNRASIGVEIKYTFSESMVEIYIIVMKSLLAPEAAFDFAEKNRIIYIQILSTNQKIILLPRFPSVPKNTRRPYYFL